MIIGHITRDTLEYRGKITPFTGGAAYFSSFAAKRSNARICVVTKLAQRDFGVLEELRRDEIEVIGDKTSGEAEFVLLCRGDEEAGWRAGEDLRSETDGREIGRGREGKNTGRSTDSSTCKFLCRKRGLP
jgi:hypothetical protein